MVTYMVPVVVIFCSSVVLKPSKPSVIHAQKLHLNSILNSTDLSQFLFVFSISVHFVGHCRHKLKSRRRKGLIPVDIGSCQPRDVIIIL